MSFSVQRQVLALGDLPGQNHLLISSDQAIVNGQMFTEERARDKG
jgi:hypothetical protein